MEAKITINGIPLTEGQAMTVRVACETFAILLSGEGLGSPLGDDEQGKRLTANYLARLEEVRELLFQ